MTTQSVHIGISTCAQQKIDEALFLKVSMKKFSTATERRPVKDRAKERPKQ